MNKNCLLLIFQFIFVSSVFSQYCTSVGPTTLIDSNVESVNLTGDAGTMSYTGCPGNLGLEDHTNLTATVTAGNNYTVNIQFGTCGGNYSGNGEAWIDFNHDQVFDNSESIGTWSGTPPVAASAFNFTVPANNVNGTTRMRIIQRENGSLPLNPCGTFQWGSAMDFSIEITGGIDCSGHQGNTIDDAISIASLPYTNTHDNSICYNNNNFAYPSVDVYYLLLPQQLGMSTAHISLCGSSFDTFLSVFEPDSTTVAFNDDSDCGAQSELNIEVGDYDSLYIVVEGWGTENGEYTLSINGEFLTTETMTDPEIAIYPNPVSDQFRINGIKNQDVLLYTITGELIKTINNYSGELIDVSELSSGIYICQINHSDQQVLVSEKILINK